jgi:hypothetical protein
MPRSGGVYSLPAGSIVANGTTADASQHNTPLNDIAADLNAARPVSAGGTGATTASGARTALGLGTAAVEDATDFATAAQGALADTAVQPADLADVATSGAYADLTGVPVVLTQEQAEDPDSTVTGLASGQRLAQAIDARVPSGRLLASGTFSAVTALDIALPSGATNARVEIYISACSVADTFLSARFTRDDFATVIDAAGAYRWNNIIVNSALAIRSSASQTNIELTYLLSGAGLLASANAYQTLEIPRYAEDGFQKIVNYHSRHVDGAARLNDVSGVGYLLASPAGDAINGVRIIPSTGNITGSYRVVSS